MHGNKRGPENDGPKTGRGLGYCSGSEAPGFESSEAPMGMRRGYCRGSGRGTGPGAGRRAGASGRPGFSRGRAQGFKNNNMESENIEIKSRLDKIETLLKEMGRE